MHLAFPCAHLVGSGAAWGWWDLSSAHNHCYKTPRPPLFFQSPRQCGCWGAVQHGTLLWNGVNFGVPRAAHRVCLGKSSYICNPSPPRPGWELRLYSPFFNFAVLRLMKHGGNGLWAGTNGTGDPALLFPSSTFVWRMHWNHLYSLWEQGPVRYA